MLATLISLKQEHWPQSEQVHSSLVTVRDTLYTLHWLWPETQIQHTLHWLWSETHKYSIHTLHWLWSETPKYSMHCTGYGPTHTNTVYTALVMVRHTHTVYTALVMV